jgi:hypothetical protein
LLLFLGRTGARVSEALGVDAYDLWLDRTRPQVLLRGKGRKEGIVPLSSDLVGALKALMRERGLEAQEQRPLFVGTHGERLTRFGATHIVRRAVATATMSRPELASKSVSPHVLRHTVAMTLLQSGVDLLIHPGLARAFASGNHTSLRCGRRRDDAPRPRRGGRLSQATRPVPAKRRSTASIGEHLNYVAGQPIRSRKITHHSATPGS